MRRADVGTKTPAGNGEQVRQGVGPLVGVGGKLHLQAKSDSASYIFKLLHKCASDWRNQFQFTSHRTIYTQACPAYPYFPNKPTTYLSSSLWLSREPGRIALKNSLFKNPKN